MTGCVGRPPNALTISVTKAAASFCSHPPLRWQCGQASAAACDALDGGLAKEVRCHGPTPLAGRLSRAVMCLRASRSGIGTAASRSSFAGNGASRFHHPRHGVDGARPRPANRRVFEDCKRVRASEDDGPFVSSQGQSVGVSGHVLARVRLAFLFCGGPPSPHRQWHS
jgi:hypothetical protein